MVPIILDVCALIPQAREQSGKYPGEFWRVPFRAKVLFAGLGHSQDQSPELFSGQVLKRNHI